MFFKREEGKESKESKELKKLKAQEGSKLSACPMRLNLLSARIGLSIALTMLFFTSVISGCASQSTKPLPMYKQIEVPTVKAYQDKVNHTQNYVYRADNTTLLKALSQNQNQHQNQ